MSPTEIVLTAVVVIAVVVAVIGVGWWRRHRSLRTRFGPEYDRASADHHGPLATDRHLRQRERRHRQLTLRELDAPTRARYAEAWQQVQTQFVESPEAAIEAAEQLMASLVAARGYPTDGQEQLAQLSVDHARTLGHYRVAREIYLRHKQGNAATEDLRQAMVHYRTLYAEVLGTDPADRGVGEEEASDAVRNRP